jgi:molybdopterin/thiamine biosynthesis adenylyltransferase
MSNHIKLKNEVQLIQNNNGEIFVRYGYSKKFTIYNNVELLKNIFPLLEKGVEINFFIESYSENEFLIIENFIHFLDSNNMLSTSEDDLLYDRQIKYFSVLNADNNEFTYQNKLYQSSVLVVGLGGIGTHLANCLASIGIRSIGICDYDVVELSNLSRCTGFGLKDIGQFKSFSFGEFLLNRNNSIDITVFNKSFLDIEDNEFLKFNVIVLCIDLNNINENQVLLKLNLLNVPFIFCNYGEQYGKIGQFNKIYKNNLKNEMVINSYIAPSVYWNSMILAGLAAKEIIAFLTNGMKSVVSDFELNLDFDDLKIFKY